MGFGYKAIRVAASARHENDDELNDCRSRSVGERLTHSAVESQYASKRPSRTARGLRPLIIMFKRKTLERGIFSASDDWSF